MAHPSSSRRCRAALNSPDDGAAQRRCSRWLGSVRSLGWGITFALGMGISWLGVWLPAVAQDVPKPEKELTPEDFVRTVTRGDWAWVAMVTLLGLALVAHFLLRTMGKRYVMPILKRWLAPPPSPSGETPTVFYRRTPDAVFQLVLLGARIILWLGAVFVITQFFPVARVWRNRFLRAVMNSFTAEVIPLGNTRYSLEDIIVLVLMILGVVIASKIIADLFKARILSLARLNRGAREAIAIILRYVLLLIGLFVLLPVWGVDLSSFAILASALGVGIGFGFQDIAKNFGSGIVLVFERPIQVGDFVEVGEFLGTIERIGARSTLIRTLDQVSIIMPNSRFLEDEVINWSHDNPVSRLHLPVGVAYASDVDKVRDVLMEAAQNHPFILSHPKPHVLFQGFGDSSLDFELLVWTRDPSKQLYIKSDLNFRIERLFRENQVEIPFPQRDLHVRSGTLPIAVPEDLSLWLRQQSNGDRPTRPPNDSSPADSTHLQ
ncbi:MAG: mechanosensitive ion channel domain-containing protein [Cyanobacteria bacterium J06638_22]